MRRGGHMPLSRDGLRVSASMDQSVSHAGGGNIQHHPLCGTHTPFQGVARVNVLPNKPNDDQFNSVAEERCEFGGYQGVGGNGQTFPPHESYRFVETVRQIPQTVIKEAVREVPRVEFQEHITYKPKVVLRERIEEVPEVEIVEVPVEKIMEIPEVREQIVIKEKRVDRYVECPVAEHIDVEIPVDVRRKFPVPLQAITTVAYQVPQIDVQVEHVPVPIYAPRFREVPVPVEQLWEEDRRACEDLLKEVEMVTGQQFPSLCEMEECGAEAKSFNVQLHTEPEIILSSWREAITDALHSGRPATTGPVPCHPSFGNVNYVRRSSEIGAMNAQSGSS